MREFTYTVTKEDIDEGYSIKDILWKRFNFSSRLRIKIKHARTVYVNGEFIPVWLNPALGDVITVAIPDEHSDFIPEDIPVIPVYEDEDLLLINKPAGYVVHPTRNHFTGTMANGVSKYMIDTDQSFKIRFINRLDMDTSGILALGKNSHAQHELSQQMKENKTEKKYLAIVKGLILEENGVIDLPIAFAEEGIKRVVREDGKPCLTEYKVVERLKGHTLVELNLKTGRTHQIRVHMSYIGHPLVGDFLYGQEEPELIDRQALHAYQLGFNHPVTGERIMVTADLPDDMKELLEKLR